MNRREFVVVSALAGGGLLLKLSKPVLASLEQQSSTRLNLYLSISTANLVTITAPVPEIGQGVRTSLPMLVAEELGVKWEMVRVVQAPGSSQYEGRYQRAAGSNSIRVYWEPMRRAGAIARDLLVRSAAETWSVLPDECETKHGFVVHESSRQRLSFGKLAEHAVTLDPNPEVRLKDASKFELLGGRTKNIDSPTVVAGRAVFGADVRVPNMVFASIERCAVYGGKIVRYEDKEAAKIAGFLQTVKVDSVGNPDRPYVREGLAVVATNTWAAFEARRRLLINWDEKPNARESTDDLHNECKRLLETPGTAVRDDGDADLAIAQAAATIDAEYHVPFIVHTPMETMNCTADIREDSATIWVPTQMPAATKSGIASRLGLPAAAITINVTRVGGGFGRRLSTDFVIEAVELSRSIGRPVQVVWSREDEISQGEFRPFSYHSLRAGLNKDGELVGWLHRQAGTSRYAFREDRNAGDSEFFENDFPAALVPNFRLEYALAASNLPRTIIRAPGRNSLGFVVESFVDEIAASLKQDPLAFRLNLLKRSGAEIEDRDDYDWDYFKPSRMLGVLNLAARQSSWGEPLPEGRGRGIACCYTFGSYVAHVVEITADPDGRASRHRIDRVVSAVDCGQIANLAGLEAQVEGGIMDGLGAALYGEIQVEKGRVKQSNFDSYRLLRYSEAPTVEVHVVKSARPPTGMGEPPYPPVAPALCNAIYATTGIRHRRLPLARAASE